MADWVTVLCFENWIKKNQNVHEYLSLTFVSKNETLLEQTANKLKKASRVRNMANPKFPRQRVLIMNFQP